MAFRGYLLSNVACFSILAIEPYPRASPPPKKNVFTLRNRPFESEIIIRIFVHNLIDFVSTNSQKHFSFALILVFF